MAKILVYPSFDKHTVEGTYDQRILWSACADAQANLSLRWSHKSHCRFCRALDHMITEISNDSLILHVTCKYFISCLCVTYTCTGIFKTFSKIILGSTALGFTNYNRQFSASVSIKLPACIIMSTSSTQKYVNGQKTSSVILHRCVFHTYSKTPSPFRFF